MTRTEFAQTYEAIRASWKSRAALAAFFGYAFYAFLPDIVHAVQQNNLAWFLFVAAGAAFEGLVCFYWARKAAIRYCEQQVCPCRQTSQSHEEGDR